MNPDNKNLLVKMIDKYPVSVTTMDQIVMYHIMVPDNAPLAICAEITATDKNGSNIYYSVFLGNDLLEEANINTGKKHTLNSVAKDIIEIMRLCSTKIIMQEAHLKHTKFMLHEISNKKNYS